MLNYSIGPDKPYRSTPSSDYRAKRRKLTESISLWYTFKRGVTLKSTAKWEKENTPTHTRILT